ncbi:hypothetical protein [Okeania sp. SIO2G5]|nr:hypothetical protein [Okeania sp. SIO2G5]
MKLFLIAGIAGFLVNPRHTSHPNSNDIKFGSIGINLFQVGVIPN